MPLSDYVTFDCIYCGLSGEITTSATNDHYDEDEEIIKYCPGCGQELIEESEE